MIPHLNVSEIFGPTLQGEGPCAGNPALFLRLAGCNLDCAWCDSAYTWDWQRFSHSAEVTALPVPEVARRLVELWTVPSRVPTVVVTGGEPALQRRALAQLIDSLPEVVWHLESNGTIADPAFYRRFSVCVISPKVSPSAQVSRKFLNGWHEPGTRAAAGPVHLKFVVRDEADLRVVDEYVSTLGPLDPGNVWFMPEGPDDASVTKRSLFVAEAALARGVNFCSRLHLYVWGSERGH